MRKLLRRLFERAGYEIFNTRHHHARDCLFTRNKPSFLGDSRFADAYQRGVQASHGVDPGFEWRVHIALWAADLARRRPGDFVECGVNAGFISSAIMRHLDWHRLGRRFFLIDTFAGPPRDQFTAEEVDLGRQALVREAEHRGAYVKDLERIKANFAEWPQVHIVQGTIPEILPSVPTTEVAFLHIDLNSAVPERAALLHFWERMPPGAVVLLDDYCYQGHEPQAEMIDTTVRELEANVMALPTGQGLIIR